MVTEASEGGGDRVGAYEEQEEKKKKKTGSGETFKYNQILQHNHSKTQKNYNQKEERKSRMRDTTVTKRISQEKRHQSQMLRWIQLTSGLNMFIKLSKALFDVSSFLGIVEEEIMSPEREREVR